jgi:hypothetical protein
MKTRQFASGIAATIGLLGALGITGCGAEVGDPQGSEAEIGSASEALAVGGLASSGHEAKYAGYLTRSGTDELWMFGGESSAAGATKKVFVYDQSANSWTAKTDLNIARKFPEVMQFPGTNLVAVIGGLDAAGNRLNSVEIFDMTNNTSTNVTATLGSVRVYGQSAPCGTATGNGAKLLYVGGETAAGAAVDTIEVITVNTANLANTTIATLKDAVPNTIHLNTARKFHDVLAFPVSGNANREIIVPGGNNGAGTLSDSELIEVTNGCVAQNVANLGGGLGFAPSVKPAFPAGHSREKFSFDKTSFSITVGGFAVSHEAILALGLDATPAHPVTTLGYDTATRSWHVAPSLAAGRGRERPAFADDGANVAVAGGDLQTAGAETSTTMADTFDPTAAGGFGAWTTVTLNKSRLGNVAAYLNGAPYTSHGINTGFVAPNTAFTGLDQIE